MLKIIGLRTLLIAAALLAIIAHSYAATPMELVQKSLQIQKLVQDYTATVTVAIDAPNLQIPERSVKVFYKSPDQVRVDSDGLAIIPRDALLMGNLGKHLETNTEAALVANGTLRERPVARIKLTPLDAGPGAGRMLCWIDTELFLLLKTELWDATAKVMTVNFTYTRVADQYWMPARLICDLAARMLDGDGEQARMTIGFTDYRVNTGLSDEIFEDQD